MVTKQQSPPGAGGVRLAGARAASRARRWVLGLALKLPGGAAAADPAALISRFPDASLLPLRRVGIDPVPELAARAAQGAITRLRLPLGLRGWLLTGHEASRTVMSAPLTEFSNDFGHMVGKVGIAAEDDPGGLGFADPPHHTRLRRLLQPHFTAHALTSQVPRVERVVGEALEEVAAAGAGGAVVDLQHHFALQVPSRVIMEILGVDESDRAEFHELSTARFDLADGAASSFDTVQRSIALLRGIVARQRTSPGDGLIGAIIREHGDEIDDVELAGLVDGVLVGGLETTVSMLSLGALVLLQHPEAWQALRDGDDHVASTVEELLRLLSVVQVGFPRFAVSDVVVDGQQLLAGDVVIPSLSAANREAALGGDTFDHTRPPTPHLAFGHGAHRCVGAELARLELRTAYPALVRAFPRMRLAVGPDELRFRELSIVHGLAALPVTLG
ncbi:cytochrome P450 family protein [Jatrophihabitans fulvus]